jgi:hypothetical protein
MQDAKIRIEYDQDTENPCEYGGWKLISFNRRHIGYKDPSTLLNQDGTAKDFGLRRKIAVGTAFLVSCYEHSGCHWGLQGEVMQCRFDTAQIAGILVWQDKPVHCGKTFEQRKENARSFLTVYTDWANGESYYFSLEDMSGNDIESCGGYIGWEHLMSGIKEVCGEKYRIVEKSGKAAFSFEVSKDKQEAQV